MHDLNFLPWRAYRQKVLTQKILIYNISLLCIFLIGCILLKTPIQHQNIKLNARIQNLKTVIKAQNETLENLKNKQQAIQKSLSIFISAAKLKGLLTEISRIIPENCQLTLFDLTPEALKLTGASNNLETLNQFDHALSKLTHFQQSTLSEIKHNQEKIQFTFNLIRA